MAKLEGNKWFVENLTGVTDCVVEVAEPKQGVFISKIKDSVVTIKGKCSAIAIENAEGSGVIFDDVVALVEVINSKKVQLQANGALNQVQIDKTNGATLFLQTSASQGAELVSSLSSELNVVVPGANEDADPVEHPVPEQFVSKFVNGKLVTGPSEHV